MKRIILLAAVLGCSLTLFAQADLQPSPALREAIQKISGLEGNWAGTGWIRMGPQRREFRQTESVRTHANGTVLSIDGLGRDLEDSTLIVHQAYAVISFDQVAGQYLMRAIRADGNHVDADFSVNPDGSIFWGFTHPMAGQIRYTIRHDEHQWTETGDMSRDGQTWMPFFEMKLQRQ